MVFSFNMIMTLNDLFGVISKANLMWDVRYFIRRKIDKNVQIQNDLLLITKGKVFNKVKNK